MNEKLNTVIHLVEQSLFDARYFLAYFFVLTLFFALIGLIEGSVIPKDDYEDLGIFAYMKTPNYYEYLK